MATNQKVGGSSPSVGTAARHVVVLRYGSVVELADTLDLGSSAHGRAGSTPARATKGAFTHPNLYPYSSAGRVAPLHGDGRRFKSCWGYGAANWLFVQIITQYSHGAVG